ncbi:DNA-directed RNA polymerase subunit beta [Alteribacillus persepolensis]|uniref:DNA-directed RNA polymerase subunit beta n=1 Tax=Alteribacillus persepolensis TaxID=568899 RepID=A0A1G8H9X4_9BACI|nr:DNA-directed RNA polymerase subunit beta [Alteribacillus persepolensis]SDI03425.1 DNA-directed RNA polymerase subunit beta [Alteribacillus persepolensis]
MTRKDDTMNISAMEDYHGEEKDTNEHAKTEKQPEKKQSRLARLLAKRESQNVRLVPIWARLVIVLLLFLFSIIAGLLVGYALIGEGSSFNILKWETWQSMMDFIQGN